MGADVKIIFFLKDKSIISRERIESFFDSISNIGWVYGSKEGRKGYDAEGGEWEFGCSFEEAVNTISEDSGGSFTICGENAEGHVDFSKSYTSLFFDGVQFRDDEENFKEIIKLLELLCEELNITCMRGGNENQISYDEEDYGDILSWANYVVGKSVENFNQSEYYKIGETGEGIFIVQSLKPIL